MSTVHDVRAARGDRPLYQRLYAITAPYVEQLFRDKTARSAEALLIDELTGLRDFVLADAPRRAQSTVPAPEHPGVRGEFARHLDAELAKASSDSSATRELAEEFSRALWGALLRRMRLGAQDDSCVRAADVFPPAGAPKAEQPNELEEALEPFGITLDEARLVLHDVLKELAADAPVLPQRVQFPLGLWIDRATLLAALDGRAAPAVPSKGLLQSILDYVKP